MNGAHPRARATRATSLAMPMTRSGFVARDVATNLPTRRTAHQRHTASETPTDERHALSTIMQAPPLDDTFAPFMTATQRTPPDAALQPTDADVQNALAREMGVANAYGTGAAEAHQEEEGTPCTDVVYSSELIDALC
jgi:hypothetical protein